MHDKKRSGTPATTTRSRAATRAATTTAALVATTLAGHAQGAHLERSPAGKLADGTPIEAFTLSNASGLSARVLTYGATLQSVLAPGRDGRKADVVLGYDTPADYEATPRYFGATIGRYANRIAHGRFALDGETYQLPLNEPGASLHGGGHGFDKQVWKVLGTDAGKLPSVTLGLSSPEGDSGYPGVLEVTVTYSLDEHGNLGIDFTATSTRPTVVNITNHALFNMAGEGAADGAEQLLLTVPASRYTPVDAALVPTGELRDVAGTAFDFRKPRSIAAGWRDGTDAQLRLGRGYDHNFVLDKGQTATPQLSARLEDPRSGRVLEVLSTEPGLQFYSGNFLDGTVAGKGGHLYRMGDGMALEPQKFPDSPNEPAFPSTRVDAGHPYRHQMIYRFTVAGRKAAPTR
jgi:aldose 1-epimerase